MILSFKRCFLVLVLCHATSLFSESNGESHNPASIVNVASGSNSYSSSVPLLPLADRAVERKAVMDELTEKGKCDGITPSISLGREQLSSLSPGSLDLKKAYEVLYALQKPGSVLERDMDLIQFFIHSKFAATDPDLIAGVMVNLSKVAPRKLETLVKENEATFNQLMHNTPKENPLSKTCLTRVQIQDQLKDLENYLLEDYLTKFLEADGDTSKPATLNDWKILSAFTPYLASFDLLPPLPGSHENRQHHVIDYIADTVFTKIDQTPALSVFPQGTKRMVAEAAFNKYFGLPPETAATAALERGESKAHLHIIGTEPAKLHDATIEKYRLMGYRVETESNAFPEVGVHTLKAKDLQGLPGQGKVIQWQVGNEVHRAMVRLSEKTKVKTSDEISDLLNDKKSCKFVSSSSPWSVYGRLERKLAEEPERSPRVKVVPTPEDLLRICEKMKREIGEEKCSNIEFAGHGATCGVSGVFALAKVSWGTYTTPDEATQFAKTGECLKSLLVKDAPIIITSCGGSADQEPSMAELFSRLEVPIIAASGNCQSRGWGAFCAAGFILYDNKTGAVPLRIERVE